MLAWMLLGKCWVQGSVQVSQTRMNTRMHVERSLLEMRLLLIIVSFWCWQTRKCCMFWMTPCDWCVIVFKSDIMTIIFAILFHSQLQNTFCREKCQLFSMESSKPRLDSFWLRTVWVCQSKRRTGIMLVAKESGISRKVSLLPQTNLGQSFIKHTQNQSQASQMLNNFTLFFIQNKIFCFEAV